MQFTDKDICSDSLTTQKYLTSEYNKCIIEAANPQLRQDFLTIWQEEQNLQRQVFDTMSSRGWYQLDQASSQDMSQVQKQFQTSGQQQQPSTFQPQYR